MYHSHITKKEQITAYIINALLLTIVLFSVSFPLFEANHNCTGEDCPVCACIEQCESTLRQFGSGMVFLIAAVMPAILSILVVFLYTTFLTPRTPISLKIRLNN